MLSSALLSLSVAGSALAWPSHARHSSIARALHARQEPAAAPAKAPIAATWYASWHAQDFPLSNVSWNKYTTVTYSFGLTTPNVSFVNITDPEVFAEFVETAHANNVSASLSIGGWTGSQFFSPAVATAENRTAFVKTMTDLVKDNKLDGLDFDWEYPGLAGIGCNAVSANDTDNFLAFLTELRAALPDTTISAATSTKPFISSDLTTPSANVSAFASVFDYIAIMNYDVWGPWSDTVGPNAPLNDTCAANATQQVGSAVSAVEAWTKAGFPADQIVLGVAGYGHGFAVLPEDGLTADNAIALYAPFNKTIPLGDAWDEEPLANATDVCGNPLTVSGNWNFWGLVEGGFLNENGTANTAEGIVYKFDECSQTPYVYNKTSGIMVAFDDAASFAVKGQFIKGAGLRGFAMWEAGGDFDDILLNSIRNGAGFPAVAEDNDEACDEEPETGSGSGSTGSGSGSSNGSGSGSSSGSSGNNGASSGNNGASSGSNSGSSNGSTGNSASTGSNNNASSGSNNSGSSGSNTGSNGSTGGSSDPEDEYEEYECDDDENPVTPTTTKASAASPTPTIDDEYDDECDEEPETYVPTTPETGSTPTTAATGSEPTTNAGANAAVPTSPAVAVPTTTEAAIPEPTADPEYEDEECEDEDETSIIDITSTASAATVTPIELTATYTLSATEAITTQVTASATESVTATMSATYTTSVTEAAATLSATETASVTETASTATETVSVAETTSVSSTESTATEAATTTSAPESKATQSTYETTSEVDAATSVPELASTVEPTSPTFEPTSSTIEATSSEPKATTTSKAETTSYKPEPTTSSTREATSAEPTTSSTPEPTVEPTISAPIVAPVPTSSAASVTFTP